MFLLLCHYWGKVHLPGVDSTLNTVGGTSECVCEGGGILMYDLLDRMSPAPPCSVLCMCLLLTEMSGFLLLRGGGGMELMDQAIHLNGF